MQIGMAMAIGARRRQLAASIKSLFSAGEQGVWYDPSDLSTLFQDAAGTTPVTAVEQPVGRMLDKSGRGNHATQTTSTSRPVLKQDAGGQYYLKFDGVDDGMVTNSINFTATDKMTVFSGVRKLSDAAAGVLAELSASLISNNGTFAWIVPSSASPTVQYVSKGTSIAGPVPSGLLAPTSLVLVGASDISAPSVVTRVNGSQVAQSSLTQGAGNYGNYPLYIGRRGGINTPFNGHLYSLIVRGAATTDPQIAQAERWVAKKTGVTL